MSLRLHSLLFAVWTVVALVVLWQYDLVGRKLDADASFMLYAGQEILRGHAPYVSVAIVKLPVSPLVAALGIGTGRAFGIEDLLAGRLAFWLCAGLTVGAVYLVGAGIRGDHRTEFDGTTKRDKETEQPEAARMFGGDHRTEFDGTTKRDKETKLPEAARMFGGGDQTDFDGTTKRGEKTGQAALLGSFAAAILLSSQALGVQVAEGPEAKLPMICAGMLCVALLGRSRFFWAGVAGAVSFMAWQPGLIFVAATLVCAVVVSERKRALAHAVAGIAAPVLLVGAYLAANDALVSMFQQAFGANANYFGEKKVAAGLGEIVLGNVGKLWDVSGECSSTEAPVIALGYAGIIGGGIYLARRMWKTRDTDIFLRSFPLALSGAALFGFTLLDLQKCSDLTPLLPYIALGGAAVLGAGLIVAARLAARGWEGRIASGEAGEENPFGRHTLAMTDGFVKMLPAVFLLVGLLTFGTQDAFEQARQTGLAGQRALAAEIASKLGPEDGIQQFGDTVVLVLTGRENATRFVHLGEKQGLGILTAEGLGMEGLTAQLEAANPRVITLSRAKNKAWAKPLYDWLESRYRLDSTYGASEGGTLKETDVYWLK